MTAPSVGYAVGVAWDGDDHLLYRLWPVTADDLLYIGLTTNLPKRLAAHRRVQPWWSDVHNVTVQCAGQNGPLAHAIEELTIWGEQPLHNIEGTTRMSVRARKLLADPDVYVGRAIAQGHTIPRFELIRHDAPARSTVCITDDQPTEPIAMSDVIPRRRRPALRECPNRPGEEATR